MVQDISSEEDAGGDDAFDPWTSRCSGPPIRCRHSVGSPEFETALVSARRVGGDRSREGGFARKLSWSTQGLCKGY